MKMKILLAALCLMCGLQAYSQQITADSPIYQATPRKEIRQCVTADGSHVVADSDKQRASGEYIMREFPTMGEIKGVVVLAAFADVPFSVDEDSISALLGNRYNADGYNEAVDFKEYSNVYGQNLELQVTIPGSARDYFRAQSFGQFVPQFDVIGPVVLDSIRAYYGGNNKNGSDKNTSGMIREACQKAYDMGLTDFADYDNDGDGVVDVVYVVYAGSDEAQTGIDECVWAKASTTSLTLGNGMKIGRYACSGELVIDLPVVAGIGTFVHEFSHILGLPDFYNTKADDFTMDSWSVLDYGMYNAEGFVPCAYTAFERYSLGWVPMRTLDAPETLCVGTTDEEGTGFRIFTSTIDSADAVVVADTASFYLVETIRREGWNRYAPASGLLISEVTYDRSAWRGNTVNAGTHHRYCIVPANNDYSYKTANKHLYGSVNHEFTLTTMPASITQFGVAMDKPLTDIRYDAAIGKTIFHFRGGNVEGGVDEIRVQDSEVCYDLQGRPVKYPSKGLYIQNGKKYIAF